MRRAGGIVTGLVSLLVVVAGCSLVGAGDEGQDTPPTSSRSRPPLSGVVVVDPPGDGTDSGDTPRWVVMYFDPATGKRELNHVMQVPDVAKSQRQPQGKALRAARLRAQFSADWQFAAYADREGGIRILQLDRKNARYAPVTRVEPPDGVVKYANPQFSPDGSKLWFTASAGGGKVKLMSVDYHSPSKPVEEATLRGPAATTAWRVLPSGSVAQIVHAGDATAELYGPNGQRARQLSNGDAQLSYLKSQGKLAMATLTIGSQPYQFVAATGKDTAVMRSVGDGAAEFGPVVTVSTKGGNLTVTPLAKSAANELDGRVVVEPSGKRALLETDYGWLLVALDSPKEPFAVRPKTMEEEDSPIAWVG